MKRRAALLFAIIVILLLFAACSGSKGEKIEWSDLELGSILPVPKSDTGQIFSDSDDRLSIYIHNTSKDEYEDYVSECRSKGFTVESDESGISYSAYNEAGYKLAVRYSDNDGELHISLDAPIEMKVLQWPTSELVSQLPVPKSDVGAISSESSDRFFVYIGKTSLEEYNAYVKECSENGFSVDYEKGDRFYYANNANGSHISLHYQGNNVMSIEIEKQEEEKREEADTANTDDSAESGPPASTQNETEDGLRPEFKEAMDSYEAFYDEYCDFMEKYKEAPTDLKLLAEYADMLTKLSEVDEAFSEWESKDLNNEELRYYLEVTNRITQKLLEIAS